MRPPSLMVDMTAIVCPHCDAENRASAKFCGSCAKLMVDLETGEPLALKRRRKRRSSSSHASKSLWLLRPTTLGIAAGILILGCAWWYLTQSARVATAHQAEAVGSFQPHPDALAPIDAPLRSAAAEAAPVVATPKPAPVLAEFPSYVNVDAQKPKAEIAKPDALKAAAQKAKLSAKDAARQRDKAQKQPPEVVTRVAEAAPAPAPAPTPAPRPAPEQSCQGQSFLSKAACMQNHCAQPGNSGQSQCKRMFEAQDALRRGSGGG